MRLNTHSLSLRKCLAAFCLTFLLLSLKVHTLKAQHSVAYQWSEVLLEGIRGDFARPTIHARNLFHVSAAMYDAWAYFDDTAEPYLLGNTVNGFSCPLPEIDITEAIEEARMRAISHAVYLIIRHRFRDSPGFSNTVSQANNVMSEYGYFQGEDPLPLSSGSAGALGGFIAQCYIDYGLQDGSNEEGEYENLYYESVNPPLFPRDPGPGRIRDRNRFQRLTLSRFVDQSGNPFENTPEFLSPEWGNVMPFALNEQDRNTYERDGNKYQVYMDPGPPPRYNDAANGLDEEYVWGFSLVSIWGSHLDPTDGVMWDISPASIGNNPQYPIDYKDYRDFYKQEGGDASRGHAINPVTGQPYASNIVHRGDYARVLAEFWADGPDSETPPGHWFSILNYVIDHPLSNNRFKGEGAALDQLEYDVKAYFSLGGTMHDAAVAAWSIKGWYDYIRPISAIRAIAVLGQSSERNGQFGYNENGFKLIPGLIELVKNDDPDLPGIENLGAIKVRTWRGPNYIGNPQTSLAGVGWIRALNWWPYQRPTFVTPPFAGYVSGHSTFSRAAAEVLTRLTGDGFFPGGMGEFVAKKNEFLVFEDGPSTDVTLQWATYKDASDQTSLSRIWGGIHPPADDIPGRIIGEQIGIKGFAFAESFFEGKSPSDFGIDNPSLRFGPNPVSRGDLLTISVFRDIEDYRFTLMMSDGTEVNNVRLSSENSTVSLDTSGMKAGIYLLKMTTPSWNQTVRFVVN